VRALPPPPVGDRVKGPADWQEKFSAVTHPARSTTPSHEIGEHCSMTGADASQDEDTGGSNSSTPEPVRHTQVSAAARKLLATEGESGRFEFKETSKAVDASVLVAAANWVALEPSRSHVTILAGVAEVVDAETGLTTGKPVGLAGNDMAVHARRIQDYARATLPVPVNVRLIEEGVATSTAFLRIEVRPTFPPHFAGSGRRITRDGASHRPLMDEELLSIYLDRETGQFEARFEGTARRTVEAVESIHQGLGGIAGELERLPELIDGAESAAYLAGSEVDDARRAIGDLEMRFDALEAKLARHLNRTPLNVFLRFRQMRRCVWRAFAIDRYVNPSKAAEKLAPRLLAQLNAPIEIDDLLFNLLSLQVWEAALVERHDKRAASMRWWQSQLKEAVSVDVSDAQSIVKDDPEGIRVLVEKWKKWSKIELEPWDEDAL